MEFSHWIEKVAAYLGHKPESGGVEEEFIKARYYDTGYKPADAAWFYKAMLQGPPEKDKRVHHF